MQEIIKIVAQYFIVLPVLAALYVFVQQKTKQARIKFVILLIAGGALSLALAKVGSYLINDPRPFVVGHFTPLIAHANDNGFPSDHTLLSSFLGFMLLTYSRKIGLASLVVAALIGGSRVAAGVHHWTDIIGSFVISALSVYSILVIIKLVTKKKAAQTETVR